MFVNTIPPHCLFLFCLTYRPSSSQRGNVYVFMRPDGLFHSWLAPCGRCVSVIPPSKDTACCQEEADLLAPLTGTESLNVILDVTWTRRGRVLLIFITADSISACS